MSAPIGQCASQSVAHFGPMVTLLIQTMSDAYCNISPPSIWPEDFGPQAVANGSLGPYDFIIFGGTGAASVLASRLSENPNCTVLLLESGSFPPTEAQVPGMVQSIQGSSVDYQFQMEYSPHVCRGMNYGTCVLPYAKMLSGPSATKSLYQRGRPHDYDYWEELGADMWSFENCLPYFLRSEDNHDFINKYHNQSGPIGVEFYPNSSLTIKDTLMTAFQQRGMQQVIDFNDFDQNQLGYGISQARQVNPGQAYLGLAKNRTNLQVMYLAQPDKLVIEDDMVTGVNITYNDTNSFTVKCNKEVILSPGAVGAAHILLLSGIGPKEHLEKIGIPVYKDAKVGENFQDQFTVPLCFQINSGSAQPVTQVDQMDSVFNYLINNDGPLAMIGIADLLQYRKKNDNTGNPDCLIQHVYYQRGAPNIASEFNAMGYNATIIQPIIDSNKVADTCCFQVALLKPKSRGKIELKSSDPADPPLISPNYLTEPDDVKILIRECKYQVEIVNTAAFQSVSAQFIQLPICTDLKSGSDKYWECYIRYMGTTNYFPVGTTKMGSTRDKSAVVDSRCKVKGIEGLRVADPSVHPTSLSCNSFAPIIMMGERVSDFIKEDWKLQIKN